MWQFNNHGSTPGSVTLSSGAASVALDVFDSPSGYQRILSFDHGYRVYGTSAPAKLQLNLGLSTTQKNNLEAVYNDSISKWGANLDGSITVVDTVFSGLPNTKVYIDELEITRTQGGAYPYRCQLTLNRWITADDTGISTFTIGGTAFRRFTALEPVAINEVQAERAIAGAVLITGSAYQQPVIWNVGLLVSGPEKSALRTAFLTQGTSYRSGIDGKFSIVDGIYGNGSFNAVMGGYSEKQSAIGRYEVSFTLTQV